MQFVQEKVRYLDVKLEVLVHLVDVGEDVADDARDDPLQLCVAQHSLHRVRLSRRRLPVREDRSVVAAQHICKARKSAL